MILRLPFSLFWVAWLAPQGHVIWHPDMGESLLKHYSLGFATGKEQWLQWQPWASFSCPHVFHQIFTEHSLRSGPSYGHLILTTALWAGSVSDSDSKKLNSMFLCCSLTFSCNWRRFSLAHVNSDVSLNTEGSGREGPVKFSSRPGGGLRRRLCEEGGMWAKLREREREGVCMCVCISVLACTHAHVHTSRARSIT